MVHRFVFEVTTHNADLADVAAEVVGRLTSDGWGPLLVDSVVLQEASAIQTFNSSGPRCGVCPACRLVELVRAQALKALASAEVYRDRYTLPIGEDVRLVWNTTLKENPCEKWDKSVPV